MPQPFRIVLDTNILLRGVLNVASPAGRVVELCDRRSIILLLSKPILAEYVSVLGNPAMIARYPELLPEKVELVLRRLRFVAESYGSLRQKFEFPRDPKDAMFIELAIAGGASHIISADADLLSLRTGHDDSASRFRQRARSVKILPAAAFLNEWETIGP